MTTPRTSLARRVVRITALVGLPLGLVLAGSPALADTPAAWPKPPHVSGLDWLVVLLLIPVGVAIVVAFLAVLPSIIHGDSGATVESWRGPGEWIGGPVHGVGATDEVTASELESASEQTGGASAQW